jgi:hypothetical protein
MTKKQMIQEIQNQEARMYFRYQFAKLNYGPEEILTKRYRSQWCAIYQLMESLGIQQDCKHPDNLAAAELRASQSETWAA